VSRSVIRTIRSRSIRIGGGAVACLALLWLAVSAVSPSRHLLPCAPVGGVAVVRDVIDGDTVQLASGERIRYIGIDTP